MQQDGSFKEGWTSALAEKFPRLANTAMRYKTEGDFLQGIDNALGLIGKKTAGVSYPKAGATPEEIAAFRAEAGVPGRAEEYNIKPEQLPEGIQKEWGVSYDERLGANRDFITARLSPEDLADPALNYALSHPAIVRMVDEARRSTRETPLPGTGASVASGSMSPRQQAVDIMKGNPQWRNDPELARRVNDLYAQQAASDKAAERPTVPA